MNTDKSLQSENHRRAAGRRFWVAIVCLTAFVSALTGPELCRAAQPAVVFGGGRAGDNLSVAATGIQDFGPVRQIPTFTVTAVPSSGSMENLKKTHTGEHHMSVVFSGDLWLGRDGRLAGDPAAYGNVLAVAWLYGTPAQLVVRKGSGIRTVGDLAGKRVGVGAAGSNDFANCELFFKHLGLWSKIKPHSMGPNDASTAFTERRLDAFWLLTGIPSGSIIMAAQNRKVDLLDLHREAEMSGYYQAYPFLSQVTIPQGTYWGVDRHTPSFQDGAIWVAHASLPPEVVYRMLSTVYSESGLRYMHNLKATFRQMSLKTGPGGIVTPFHPGAEAFWKEKLGAAFAVRTRIGG